MKPVLYLCGQKHFGAAVLEAVTVAGYKVAGVSSPAWQNARLAPADPNPGCGLDRLRVAAGRFGVPWRPAGRLGPEHTPAPAELIVAAHSHDFLSAKVRRGVTYGALGFHPSLLPLHRGRDAVRWAIKMRERVTGGSVYWFTDRVDAGPIAAQDWCFIRPDDTAESLWRRELSPMGVRLILAVLADVSRGRLVGVSQDEKLATWEPALDAAPLTRPDLPALEPIGGSPWTGDPAELHGPATARAALYDVSVP